jgi:hypothetical protein
MIEVMDVVGRGLEGRVSHLAGRRNPRRRLVPFPIVDVIPCDPRPGWSIEICRLGW